ncbi:transmembrane protein, putative (macronuclear) [Tetrahymena thermophila SB210]|uniref:Transmembrane protein, putative n=1 Tax=Tetrahymena thermophila (strain SB210) TaxID=312017 RepID=W7XI63_TETTS|nr:transmembrane protein, putative [Tetrahymena thermophila SB210]EWS73039.1 transmembrane protein, putative [Tetrahymena thermophila SB210]|eukprot:XP_012654436.1 transmembrane protein, putative [Tetrahymena thermophila SB210]
MNHKKKRQLNFQLSKKAVMCTCTDIVICKITETAKNKLDYIKKCLILVNLFWTLSTQFYNEDFTSTCSYCFLNRLEMKINLQVKRQTQIYLSSNRRDKLLIQIFTVYNNIQKNSEKSHKNNNQNLQQNKQNQSLQFNIQEYFKTILFVFLLNILLFCLQQLIETYLFIQKYKVKFIKNAFLQL